MVKLVVLLKGDIQDRYVIWDNLDLEIGILWQRGYIHPSGEDRYPKAILFSGRTLEPTITYEREFLGIVNNEDEIARKLYECAVEYASDLAKRYRAKFSDETKKARQRLKVRRR